MEIWTERGKMVRRYPDRIQRSRDSGVRGKGWLQISSEGWILSRMIDRGSRATEV
jgi:hypothetical protein